MERAGRAVACDVRRISSAAPTAPRVVLCGKGTTAATG